MVNYNAGLGATPDATTNMGGASGIDVSGPRNGEKTGQQVVAGSNMVIIGATDSGSAVYRSMRLSYPEYRRMRREPTIAIGRWLVTAPVIAASWSVESNEKAPPGAKDFIDEQMKVVKNKMLQSIMLNFVDFGWAPFEVVLELTPEQRVGINKIKPLLVDMTDIMVNSDTGALMGVKNGDAELMIEDAECLVFSFEPEGTDWYGKPLLENVRDSYESGKRVDEASNRYDEKVAGTHLVVYYPVGMSPLNGVETDNRVIAESILRAFQASGCCAVPVQTSEGKTETPDAPVDGWKIELLSDSGGAQMAFTERQSYLDRRKVRGLGLPERAVLEAKSGTRADAHAHTDFATVNMELRHMFVVEDVNKHLVDALLRLNWGKEAEKTVWIKPGPLTDADKQWLGDMYMAYVGTPDGSLQEATEVDMQAIRDRLGVPTLPADRQAANAEDLIAKLKAAGAGTGAAPPASKGPEAGKPSRPASSAGAGAADDEGDQQD